MRSGGEFLAGWFGVGTGGGEGTGAGGGAGMSFFCGFNSKVYFYAVKVTGSSSQNEKASCEHCSAGFSVLKL